MNTTGASEVFQQIPDSGIFVDMGVDEQVQRGKWGGITESAWNATLEAVAVCRAVAIAVLGAEAHRHCCVDCSLSSGRDIAGGVQVPVKRPIAELAADSFGQRHGVDREQAPAERLDVRQYERGLQRNTQHRPA